MNPSHNIIISLARLNDVGYKYVQSLQHNDVSVLYGCGIDESLCSAVSSENYVFH